MKIHGVDGMSAENIRDEVNRGGRLVIYTYCVSLLVVTLKRSGGIHLIKAGHSPASASWPWVGISLLLGWWGFPWGPIYTIETIYRNLSGGIDVTNDVLASLFPASPVVALSVMPVAASAISAPAAPPPLRTPLPPSRGFNKKAALMMATAFSLLVLTGISVFCWVRQQELDVVLISGLDEASSVVVNGKSHALPPHGVRHLTMPEGEFEVRDSRGETQRFTFAIPFFDHLSEQKVAIINPDRTAVVLSTDIEYYKDGTTPPGDREPQYSMLANQAFYFIPKPDYLFEPAAEHISMPSGTTRTVKTRLENFTSKNLRPVMEALVKKRGYDEAREHLILLARYRTDDALVGAALATLKPADVPAFYRLHLADRPVKVDWHRYYQHAMDLRHPEHDLVQEYRGYLQAEPGNGDLMYLLGRQVTDEAEADRLWHDALKAAPPSGYAHGAIGFNYASEGRFAEALEHYSAVKQAGIDSASRRQYRRQLLWILNQPEPLFADLTDARKDQPMDMALADEEIRATLAFRHDPVAAKKLKDAYVAKYKSIGATTQEATQADTYLQAMMAYQNGDLAAYAAAVTHLDSTDHTFCAACSMGDLALARKAIADLKDSDSSNRWLLLYIVAKTKGDAGAEAHFAKAVEAMKSGTRTHRRIVAMLAGPSIEPGAFCALQFPLEEKRVLLTALGLHDPANRETYFALARKLNADPAFPYLLLKTVLAQAT